MSKETSAAVIYHANCPDGFGAAMGIVECDAHRLVELVPMAYGDELDTQVFKHYRHIYVLDFSLPFDVLIYLARSGCRVLQLDHHISAMDTFAREASQLYNYDLDKSRLVGQEDYGDGSLNVFFDITRSGAELTWSIKVGKVPDLIRYIGDRDMWRFELDDSEAISAYIASIPMTIEDYRKALKMTKEQLSTLGAGAVSLRKAAVDDACRNAYITKIAGYWMPITNATKIIGSDVAHQLMQEYGTEVSGYYYELKNGDYKYGLRSAPGFRVDDIAQTFGGGGHKQASGFVRDVLPYRPDLQELANYEVRTMNVLSGQ